MKKILLVILLFVAIGANAQGIPKWLGSSVDTTMQILPTLQSYLMVNFIKAPNDYNKARTVYFDEKHICGIRVEADVKKQLVGNNILSLPEKVTNFEVSGPAESIKKLFDEYFIPIAKTSTDYVAQNSFARFNKWFIIYRPYHNNQLGIDMAEIILRVD